MVNEKETYTMYDDLLFEGESYKSYETDVEELIVSDDVINKKYTQGVSRIITEHGSFKLVNFLSTINSETDGKKVYKLKPKYQRRLTWDAEQKSKLIESFIMNVPVPPVFLYEYEYGFYEVMDGLQRMTTIKEFLENTFALTGLVEWSELNNRYFENLPEQIRNGIGRRDLYYINLLKESTTEEEKAKTMKKVVFERLNTGGMKLDPQEIRNALYGGKFNDLCVELSENSIYRNLWGFASIDHPEKLSADSKYSRMTDVETVLRFFAMKLIKHFSNSKKLKVFLDNILRHGNTYSDDLLLELKDEFIKSINLANKLFGKSAYCGYNIKKNTWRTKNPSYTYYDPMMIACRYYINKDLNENYSLEKRLYKLKEFYIEYDKNFDGKRQERKPINDRATLYITLFEDFFV